MLVACVSVVLLELAWFVSSLLSAGLDLVLNFFNVPKNLLVALIVMSKERFFANARCWYPVAGESVDEDEDEDEDIRAGEDAEAEKGGAAPDDDDDDDDADSAIDAIDVEGGEDSPLLLLLVSSLPACLFELTTTGLLVVLLTSTGFLAQNLGLSELLGSSALLLAVFKLFELPFFRLMFSLLLLSLPLLPLLSSEITFVP